MNLPDTCVWVEVLRNTATGRRYRSLLEVPDQILVPTLVLYELRRWALRELDEDAADRILAVAHRSRILALTETIALHAAELAHAHRLASMDALIYASALHSGATLVTCDAHFKGLAGVQYQAKAAH